MHCLLIMSTSISDDKIVKLTTSTTQTYEVILGIIVEITLFIVLFYGLSKLFLYLTGLSIDPVETLALDAANRNGNNEPTLGRQSFTPSLHIYQSADCQRDLDMDYALLWIPFLDDDYPDDLHHEPPTKSVYLLHEILGWKFFRAWDIPTRHVLQVLPHDDFNIPFLRHQNELHLYRPSKPLTRQRRLPVLEQKVTTDLPLSSDTLLPLPTRIVVLSDIESPDLE